MRNQTFDNSSSASTFKAYYPTYDGDVSEYLLADSSVAAHWEYDPFGNTVKTSGSESSTNNFRNIVSRTAVHRFSTKPYNVYSELYYYGYRYYDPVTGRWPSRDPIDERGGTNLYGMIGNDLVRRWDYLGLASSCCGPDATLWFIEELKAVRQRLMKKIKQNMSDPNFGPADSIDWVLKNNGEKTQMDSYPSEKVVGFGTGDCKSYYMLFGSCVNWKDMGNILFGFVTKYMRVSPTARNFGADINNRIIGQGPEGFNQTVEYSVGGNLLNWMDQNPTMDLNSAENFIERQKAIFGNLIQYLGAKSLRSCKPCGKSLKKDAIGRRFSEASWQIKVLKKPKPVVLFPSMRYRPSVPQVPAPRRVGR